MLNSIDKSIADAVASVEMEGYHVDEDCKEHCRMLLQKEINLDEYLVYARKKAGLTG